ncbi:DUF1254 domain-containing protein [Rhodococcus hoagii]|uniref:DUF1254 domain-containing protein n=2 Tax=Rhodococcus hoagii TaxID=43767 RepID=A0AAE2W3W8_RHOHA|nr:DUF1254 domain-containing protein [Prescottella equi]MBM4467958.1 DUF1254 domain-containing protein [Prescottella equi]MBM4476144.1 DUF1254 domain-containing protein [Prescottella equi]MBM4493041.1 DUF1254 domain-containing protein [Prescottella equi]MBM4510833.1 DUF1254 domain-containing protein [Prescottella equi]MBM4539440.1 DUF1254 domain-containing protein [Prescottella equi]
MTHPSGDSAVGSDSTVTVESAVSAFVYGFAPVFNLSQVERFVTTGVGANSAAPFNSFSHADGLAGPDDTFVSINNDTIYSMAQLDLSVGPLILDVPDTADAYFVLQFVDAWTNNFAYIGKRATGTKAGRYVLVPPGWPGELPSDATAVHCSTRIVSIVGRWACDGPDDIDRVRDLQDRIALTPLVTKDPEGLPEPDPAVPEELAFWERLRLYLQAFPPAPRDIALQQAFAPLGLLESGSSPYVNPDPALAKILVEGAAQGRARIEQALKSGSDATVVNGWHQAFHIFDYNDDFFEIGTLDSPEWRIEDRRKAIGVRAAAAMGGLWGNHGYEAAYSQIYTDATGAQLTGEHTYAITFASPPPVEAFWSITMYSMPHFYLVSNPIERYSIGDRTPGLVYDDNGSLTLTLSATEPADPVARANWLPTPAGPFRPLLRMYIPNKAVLDGSYEMPPIVKVDGQG